MLLRGAFGGGERGPGVLLVDTARTFPLALDLPGWKKAGVAATLKAVPTG